MFYELSFVYMMWGVTLFNIKSWQCRTGIHTHRVLWFFNTTSYLSFQRRLKKWKFQLNIVCNKGKYSDFVTPSKLFYSYSPFRKHLRHYLDILFDDILSCLFLLPHTPPRHVQVPDLYSYACAVEFHFRTLHCSQPRSPIRTIDRPLYTMQGIKR